MFLMKFHENFQIRSKKPYLCQKCYLCEARSWPTKVKFLPYKGKKKSTAWDAIGSYRWCLAVTREFGYPPLEYSSQNRRERASERYFSVIWRFWALFSTQTENLLQAQGPSGSGVTSIVESYKIPIFLGSYRQIWSRFDGVQPTSLFLRAFP